MTACKRTRRFYDSIGGLNNGAGTKQDYLLNDAGQ